MTSPLLSAALACAGTYEPGAVFQWEDKKKTVHVALSLIDDIHNLSWEGTTDAAEWMIDFLALARTPKHHPRLGPLHLGFTQDVEEVLPQILDYLTSIGRPPYRAQGHSKGAGEVLIFHGMMLDLGYPPVATVAFEPPKVCTQTFVDFTAGQEIAQTQTVNIHGPDDVTIVPPWDPWIFARPPLVLTVPDSYDVATKHRIPAVIEALQTLPG